MSQTKTEQQQNDFNEVKREIKRENPIRTQTKPLYVSKWLDTANEF